MSLIDYRRKRRFEHTREPEPGKSLPKGRRVIFVVQLHHASRRHYDFRLQVGDTLKSWAVPKGPSYDPSVKRMAVEVEDHPVAYADFEGEIAKGQYGGGHVAQFDHGIWVTEGDPETQLTKGHLRFELFGNKLKGGWHLVRSGKPARQPQWLLFKDRDAFAGDLEADDLLADVTPAPESDKQRAGRGKTEKKRMVTVPVKSGRRKDWSKRALSLEGARKGRVPTGPFQPQLAKLGQTPPKGELWLHELKWDGYRLLVTVADGTVRLWSRNALEWTARLPEIREALEGLRLDSASLDGEVIAGQGAQEDFNLLQATLSGERQGRLTLMLFDLLHLQGVHVANVPLIERKELLQDLLKGASPLLAFCAHVDTDGETAFRVASEQHYEGVISKRFDQPYHPGRSDDWRKTKQLASDEFAVVGFTAPKGARTGFGSLLLASPDASHGWRYAGRVGTGFDDALLKQLMLRLRGGGSKPTVYIGTTETDLRTAKWFAPRFVVEVFYRGRGGQTLLRQPSLKALRLDKNVNDLLDSDRMPMTRQKTTGAKRSKPATKAAKAMLPTLSSPTKRLFPADNISKQDVRDYYLAIADHLLPEIVGRPLSVIRCPAGIERQCFFQKHMTAGIERVSSVKLKEESGSQADYLVVEDLAGLMELVQLNALEFHPWGAKADTPDIADRVVFDLDPGPDVPFAEVKRAAADIRKLLLGIELESFLRVSGGKGLHVVVPLAPVPSHRHQEPPKSSHLHRLPAQRTRCNRGASYSMRARPGAPVALPLAWGDLTKLHRADAFTIKDVPAKLKRRRKDPWAGMDSLKQNLSRWANDT